MSFSHPELLIHWMILDRLSLLELFSLRLVNHSWKDNVDAYFRNFRTLSLFPTNSILSIRLQFNFDFNVIPNRELPTPIDNNMKPESIVTLFPNIEILYYPLDYRSSEQLVGMLKQWLNIRELHLFYATTDIASIVNQLCHLPKLETLTLGMDSFTIQININRPINMRFLFAKVHAMFDVGDLFKYPYIDNVRSLQVIDHSEFEHVKMDIYPNLRSLGISLYMASVDFYRKTIDPLRLFMDNCPQLEAINILNCFDSFSEYPQADARFEILFNYLNKIPTLKRLAVETGSVYMLVEILKKCHLLEHVVELHIDFHSRRESDVRPLDFGDEPLPAMNSVKSIYFYSFRSKAHEIVNGFDVSKIPCRVSRTTIPNKIRLLDRRDPTRVEIYSNLFSEAN